MSFPPFKHPLNAVCADVWHRLKDSERFCISQGEETLTNNLMLKIWRGRKKKFRDIRVIQTPRGKEPKVGSDWVWWIGNGRHRLHYAVQAKKLHLSKKKKIPGQITRYLPGNKYSIGHEIGGKGSGRYQRDRLQSYEAKTKKVIALYAFYNHIDKQFLSNDYLKKEADGGYWGCCQPAKARMLGFTVTPLKSILRVSPNPEHMTFEEIHQLPETIPVRCLACWRGQSALFGGASNRNQVMSDYAQPLPAIFQDGLLSEENVDEYFSKRILIIEGKD